MATVAQVMVASLKNIIVAASESEINSDDAGDFMFAMNIYMTNLAADGINLGYTEVNSLDDQVTIPTGALYGLVKNMAVVSAPDFGYPIPNELRQEAGAGLRVMEKIGVTIGPSAFPSTLPRGSGNERNSAFATHHFYPDLEAQILLEASGPIGLETGTEAAIT